MPDWLIHIAVGVIIFRLFNLNSLFFIIIGTILPDFIWLFQTLRDSFDILNITTIDSLIVIPYHTPLVTFLIATIVSLNFKEWKVVFFSILIGVISHFILDSLIIGELLCPFYPFSLDPCFSFYLFRLNSIIGYTLEFFSLIIIIIGFIQSKKELYYLFPRKESVVLLIILIGIVFSFHNSVENDFYLIKLNNNLTEYNDKNIYLPNQKITAINPTSIVIGNNYSISLIDSNNKPISEVLLNERVSISGVINASDMKITCLDIEVMDPYQKTMTSLLALIIFTIFTLKSIRIEAL